MNKLNGIMHKSKRNSELIFLLRKTHAKHNNMGSIPYGREAFSISLGISNFFAFDGMVTSGKTLSHS